MPERKYTPKQHNPPIVAWIENKKKAFRRVWAKEPPPRHPEKNKNARKVLASLIIVVVARGQWPDLSRGPRRAIAMAMLDMLCMLFFWS